MPPVPPVHLEPPFGGGPGPVRSRHRQLQVVLAVLQRADIDGDGHRVGCRGDGFHPGDHGRRRACPGPQGTLNPGQQSLALAHHRHRDVHPLPALQAVDLPIDDHFIAAVDGGLAAHGRDRLFAVLRKFPARSPDEERVRHANPALVERKEPLPHPGGRAALVDGLDADQQRYGRHGCGEGGPRLALYGSEDDGKAVGPVAGEEAGAGRIERGFVQLRGGRHDRRVPVSEPRELRGQVGEGAVVSRSVALVVWARLQLVPQRIEPPADPSNGGEAVLGRLVADPAPKHPAADRPRILEPAAHHLGLVPVLVPPGERIADALHIGPGHVDQTLVQQQLESPADVFGPTVVAGDREHGIGEPPEPLGKLDPFGAGKILVDAFVEVRQQFVDRGQPADQLRVGVPQPGKEVRFGQPLPARAMIGHGEEQLAPPIGGRTIVGQVDGRRVVSQPREGVYGLGDGVGVVRPVLGRLVHVGQEVVDDERRVALGYRATAPVLVVAAETDVVGLRRAVGHGEGAVGLALVVDCEDLTDAVGDRPLPADLLGEGRFREQEGQREEAEGRAHEG